jgi:hypothetical protein
LLSLAKIPVTGLPGTDLSPALRGETPAPKLTAFSHTALVPEHFHKSIGQYPRLQARFPARSTEQMWVGLRRGDDFFQLAQNTETRELEPGLYAIESDKGKQHDLFEPGNPTHREAIGELHAYRKRLIDGYRPPEKHLRVPADDEKRRLRALGYIK